MNRIANFFLRARHWQIFLLLFGLFCLGGALSWILSSAPESFGIPLPVFAVMGVVACGFAFWLWSLGVFLNSVTDSPLRPKLVFFRVAVVYPLIHIPILGAFFQSLNPMWFAVIFPLHLFATFCLFYSFYFVSKNLVLVERVRPVSFSDYAGAFFLIWFFPIGVWFTQPRINRIYAGMGTL